MATSDRENEMQTVEDTLKDLPHTNKVKKPVLEWMQGPVKENIMRMATEFPARVETHH